MALWAECICGGDGGASPALGIYASRLGRRGLRGKAEQIFKNIVGATDGSGNAKRTAEATQSMAPLTARVWHSAQCPLIANPGHRICFDE